jgi:hypothetical protein
MSRRILKNWGKIVNLYVRYEKKDLIDDILNKWSTSAGVFTSKEYEIKQKCIAIRRVAFLIYSGDQD